MFFDLIQFFVIFLQFMLLKFMRFLHYSAQLLLLVLNCIWLVVIFWPMFYYRILSDPEGRSILAILGNSTNSTGITVPEGKASNRKPEPPKIKFYNQSKLILTSPQSQGAHAHVDEDGRPTVCDHLLRDMYYLQIHSSDPLRLKVPYEYLAKNQVQPPEGCLYDVIAFIALTLTFLWPIVKGYTRLIRILAMRRAVKYYPGLLKSTQDDPKQLNKRKSKKVALTTALLSKERYAFLAENVSEAYLTSWDTDGIFFCVDNCATCIICNDKSMFVGELKRSTSEVVTSNGQNTPKQVGTIRIVLTDDGGTTHQYDIPGALYDPESPFNLLGIPYLSKFFGDQKEMGTKITSGAYNSCFIWDHGQHERNFAHGVDCLPALEVNAGESYYTAFCTRLSTFYNDNVRFGFCSASSKKVSFEDAAKKPAQTKRKFAYKFFRKGMELTCKDGSGSNESVVYEGATKKGMMHRVRKADGTTVEVDESQLLQIHQPDLTNIPSTPLDYQKEVNIGYLSREEALKLANPRTLSPIQQLLMDWHHRLYHLPFRRIFMLSQMGLLPKSLLKCQDNVPLCVACQFGSAHRRPWRVKGKKSGTIRKEKEEQPGDGQSIDKIVSAQPGLIPQMSGFLTSSRYFGVTTIVDHVSDYVYVHLMKDLTLDETMKAKRAWEKILNSADRTAKHYQADNGRFADAGFKQDCVDHNQTISFCGVGAHHQNGIVEGKNKILTQGARTLLLHGMRMWPLMITTMFWPFAIKAMAERMNKLHILSDGSTPESKLYSLDKNTIPVGSYHTLFCPIYVLDSRSQSAGAIGPPKWEPRSRIGIYLGHSPFHAGSVALVFNPTTGLVSPQYHVVFDDNFSTVPYMNKGEVPDNWDELYKYSRELATDEDYDLAESWFRGQADDSNHAGNMKTPANPFEVTQASPKGVRFDVRDVGPSNSSTGEFIDGFPVSDYEGVSGMQGSLKSDNVDEHASILPFDKTDGKPHADSDQDGPSQLHMPTCINLHESGLRRSERIKQLNNSSQNADGKSTKRKAHMAFGTVINKIAWLGGIYALLTTVQMPNHSLPENPSFTSKLVNTFHECNELYDGTINQIHNYAFATELANNEVFTFTQAMRQDDRGLFLEAMEKEVQDHEKRDHWSLVLRSTIPRGIKTIQAIWSFKRKRFPDGTLNKHKARLCAHGGMQEWGENYWETYSPVVNMLSVRLILAIAHIHKLDSKSIDFVLAFPQAELDVDIWMELPRAFVPEDDPENKRAYVLKLKKNLYGLKQASFNWFDKLKTGLVDRGFKPSQIDPCLYFKKGMIVLTYVDDCIIVGTEMKKIDSFVESMKNGKENFDLTDEGDIDKFLGIEIDHLDEKRFEMKQPYLIERICHTLGLLDNEWEATTNTKKSPVGKPVLNKDLDGKPRKLKWKYRTAVGMISYLQGNTRPDISMACHQTARFCIDPKLSHEQAIMRIGRYLLGTKDRGIIYEPDPKKGLECYVDADFAGGWSLADSDDADNVMSRTGYVLFYAGCPIYWVSKLQTEIALSTAESEYIALSSALREVIPLMRLMEEINEIYPLYIDKPNFLCKVFEDNQSCIKMAVAPKFTPRTKHIALKYHHFKAHVGNRIDISYISTDLQKADIFTKPLPDDAFFRLRHMLMGL